MRKNKKHIPEHMIDEEYIYECIEGYMYEYEDEDDENDENDEDGENDENKDIAYGGSWYQRGKESKLGLFAFYEKFGFQEDPRVHKEWKCFSDIPLPSMRLLL